MNLSPNVEQRIRLLSDDSLDAHSLYRKACHFVSSLVEDPDAEIPGTAQLTSVELFAEQFHELTTFVTHQEDRFEDDRRGPFYEQLKGMLRELEKLATDEFVSKDASKKERQEQKEFYATLLAREFVRHVVAEAQLEYRKRGNRREGGRDVSDV